MNPRIVEEMERGLRRLAALQLWQLEAVKLNLAQPFKLASGNFSPIYVNCRQLISVPAFADLFTAATRILGEARAIEFDVIAGGETAGIPFAAILAKGLGRPMIYVRKAAKDYGTASRIEGTSPRDARVLLVEDLITDAGSKLSFVEAIDAAGGRVTDVLVVFDRLQGGREALAAKHIRLHSLCDMDEALAVAGSAGLVSAADLDSVGRYLADPAAWHRERGLAFQG